MATPPVSMERFVDALGSLPAGEPTEAGVMEVLRTHRVSQEELRRHVVWNDDSYTRTLIYRDDRFQVIALGWGVGHVTPVHDHAGQRCWMMIERGRLRISDYRWKEGAGPPRLLNEEVVGGEPGRLHVDTCACVHQIANPEAWEQPAVSLHVYSRPFSSCGVYCLETGAREEVDLRFDRVGELAEVSAAEVRDR